MIVLAALSTLPETALRAGATPASTTSPNTVSQLINQQGSGVPTNYGDYVSASIHAPYRYYIEVPAGLPRLMVDLFDADILAATVNADDTNERDRELNANGSCVQYLLRDPTGAQRARVVKGTAANCVIAVTNNTGDNIWQSFYDSNAESAVAPVVVASSSTGTLGEVTSINLTLPAGTQVGNLLIAAVGIDEDGAGVTIAAPAGWTQIDQGDCGTTVCRLAVFWHVYAGTETTPFNFSWAGNQKPAGGVIAISGYDPNNVIGPSAAATNGAANNTITAPTTASTTANSRVLRLAVAGGNGAVGAGGGQTLAFSIGSAAAGGAGAEASSAHAQHAAQAAAGAPAAVAFGALGANQFWRALTVSIPGSAAVQIQRGHWQLSVDMSPAVTTGQSVNAFGIRANDGDATGGGTELNLYAETFLITGINANTRTRTANSYPYVTAGCTTHEFDFDFDSGATDENGATLPNPPWGTLSIVRRGGGFNFSDNVLSLNDVWQNDAITAWNTISDRIGYGLWNATHTITDYTQGGSRGNYAPYYFGYESTTQPPTTAPQANSFRIYLPADASVAGGTIVPPVKPYMEQFARYGGCGAGNDGPTTPTSGQTTCMTVTVTLVNPSAQAINFGTPSTDEVTVNVPGPVANVWYHLRGTGSPSQGTVTSEPADLGIGTIHWNPGTLAAGATALLSFRVQVHPTGAGTLDLTGNVTTNGTRAVWLDGTANTVQARATYTFGPLCQLSVTAGLLTEALVSDFRAYEESGAVAVEWNTASEAGTVGFYLERFDRTTKRFVRVSKDLLPALAHSPQGGTYRFVDPTASLRDAMSRYRLIEVRADGQRRRLGPFEVKVDWEHGRSAQLVGGQDFERVEHTSEQREVPVAEDAKVASPAAQKPVDSLRIGVRETGIQFISSSTLAQALGETQATVESLLSRGAFTLSKQGQPVWWLADPITRKKPSAGMYFYGEAIHDLYSPDQAYRLTRIAGPVMPAVAVSSGAASVGDTFVDLKHSEVDAFPSTVVPLNPESDYWFWDGFVAGSPGKAFSLDAPGAGAAGSAALKLHFQGISSSGVANEHHVQASLNGVPVGEWRWTGIAASEVSFPISATTLLESGNQLQLTAILDPGTPYSFTDFDFAELGYPRAYRAVSDALIFRPDGHAALSVNGFAGADVRLFDVGNPLQPRSLVGATSTTNAGTFSIGFTPPSGSSTYAAMGPAGGKTPSLRPWIDGQLKASGRGADYLVVTTAALSDAAQRLANARESQGLRTAVVDVEAVMNEFNGGRSNPHALHDFLAYAASFWNPAPRYVVFAGAGSLDYRNLLGNGDSLVPTILVSTSGGLFGSDNRVADLVGNDGIPDIAVGRIPATTVQQLNDYVDKLLAYEADPGAWAGNVLALADAQDQGANFSLDSDQVLSKLSANYLPARIYLDSVPLSAARTQLLSGINSGASFIDYLGHGGLDRLSAGGLLSSSDVGGLQNGSLLPILTAMTCTVNRFTVPGIPSLGEQLVNRAGGGAAAVWAPSALSTSSDAEVLAEKFYSAVSATQAPRLGDLILQALRDFRNSGGNPSMFDIYVLLGDPALRWKPAPRVP